MRAISAKHAALIVALSGIASLSDVDVATAQPEPTRAGGATRRERTPEQSTERISARQRKRAAKAARRVTRAAVESAT